MSEKVKKKESWWEDLNKYIDTCRGKHIDWDTFDCCQFICGAVEAISDHNPYVHFPYKYNTRSMAVKAVKAFSRSGYNNGIKHIVNSIGAKIGSEKIYEGYPQRGDIVVVDIENEYLCGVCVGSDIAIIHEEMGLVFAPKKQLQIKTIQRIPWAL